MPSKDVVAAARIEWGRLRAANPSLPALYDIEADFLAGRMSTGEAARRLQAQFNAAVRAVTPSVPAAGAATPRPAPRSDAALLAEYNAMPAGPARHRFRLNHWRALVSAAAAEAEASAAAGRAAALARFNSMPPGPERDDFLALNLSACRPAPSAARFCRKNLEELKTTHIA
ncbi:MAG TPA: hypothetical protein PKE47_11905 [Verrucomicrobiota bacterium]|nr:hypothetical protein [Verrucomicrobiota bacterium]